MSRLLRSRLIWPVAVLLVLLVINVSVVPGFLTVTVRDGHLFGSLVDIARNGAPTLIIAVAMTLVIATRGIDLSVGAVGAIAGALTCSIIIDAPDPGSPATVAAAIGISLVLALALGLWNGALVAALGLQPIVATLILMTAGRGVAMLITEGQIVTVNSPAFKVIGSGFLLGVPVPVLIAVAVVVLAAVLTRRTALGLLIESVGINPEASRQAGIRSRGLVIGVYVACALAAALAGLVLTSNQTAADANNTGLFIELDAILAVVIGGTSLAGGRYSLAGTVVGALVIQTLVTTVYTVGIPPIVTMIFKAAVITAVCLLQSPATTATLARWRRSLRGSPPAGAAPPPPSTPLVQGSGAKVALR
ncbi:ABC transporter permease [Microlunatus capsulatus]|uniref:Simple sugar transport system permease protein n=1 Tax=Microlunatus capsulatus TaxID=99117 RepID=A0ABS4Z998_9ACTN|nr:ABC transporter permease [Microlunatus capsulatus]MBP2417624.1 simple sugar transport system permease protein [Microlunatus capsulatus]